MYSIAQIESLTGISGHTLRIWERRYSFIQPSRTSTNIRQYSDKDLLKLLNVGILIENGFRVSKVDELQEDEIVNKVKELLDSEFFVHATEINGLVISMLELDEFKFLEIFDSSVESIGFEKTVMEVLYPFLSRVGGLWRTEDLVPAEEHFVSSLVKQKLLSAIDHLPGTTNSNRSIMLFLPPGEHHEIGLLFANYLARKQEWKVFYFGQNLPIDNLPALEAKLNPTYMLTFFVLPNVSRAKELIKEIKKCTNTPLLVSGNSTNFKGEMQNVRYLRDPEELLSILV